MAYEEQILQQGGKVLHLQSWWNIYPIMRKEAIEFFTK
jgi:hypothetical protein